MRPDKCESSPNIYIYVLRLYNENNNRRDRFLVILLETRMHLTNNNTCICTLWCNDERTRCCELVDSMRTYAYACIVHIHVCTSSSHRVAHRMRMRCMFVSTCYASHAWWARALLLYMHASETIRYTARTYHVHAHARMLYLSSTPSIT